ncbi:hypothetical protein BH11PSE3_BH11PSE3_26010 [soil metagenome]
MLQDDHAGRRRRDRAPLKRRRTLVGVAAAALCLLPATGFAQRGDTATESRLNQLQRTLGELSQQLEQLRQRDQQLQQQFEKMRTDYEQRLERLEKGGKAKPPVRPSGASKPK